MNEFERLGLSEKIAAGMQSLGYETPTRIQESAVPRIVEGTSVIMRSDTGTGKTLAYLLPILGILEKTEGAGSKPKACVVAPTQELAVQIMHETERLAKACGIECHPVLAIGGSLLSRQAKTIHSGSGVVIGTSGRVRDLVAIGELNLDRCELLVFDEVDKIFCKETREEAERILELSPEKAIKVFVSATVSEKIKEDLSSRVAGIAVCDPGAEGILSDAIEHWAFYEESRRKVNFLRSFLAAVRPERCLVFFSRADHAAEAADKLSHHGFAVAAIHARAEQSERKKAIDQFKAGTTKVLITSDLGARGLDVPGITHIISVDLPDDADVYVHRAGRTGRAGAKGVSVIAADLVELQRASRIAVKKKFSFICMELTNGEIHDKDPEAFFAEAEAADSERRILQAERRSGAREDYSGERKPIGRTFVSQQGPRRSAPPRQVGREGPRDARRSPGSYDRGTAGRERGPVGYDRAPASRDRNQSGRDRPSLPYDRDGRGAAGQRRPDGRGEARTGRAGRPVGPGGASPIDDQLAYAREEAAREGRNPETRAPKDRPQRPEGRSRDGARKPEGPRRDKGPQQKGPQPRGRRSSGRGGNDGPHGKRAE